MEKNTKIIIGVIVVVAILLVGFFILSNQEGHLIADDTQVTVPSNYSVQNDLAASAGDVNISFVAQKGSTSSKQFENEFFGALKANGKASGYKNVTNKTINGYTAHEFAGTLDKLKNVSTNEKSTSDGGISWTTYPPEAVALTTDGKVDHFRAVNYLKGDDVYTLRIYTSNPDTNLFTPEIDKIIDSIAPVENK